MKTYARMTGDTVAEIIEPFIGDDGNEVAIVDRFHPDIAATIVDMTGAGAQPGDRIVAGVVVPHSPPTLTAEQKIAAAEHAVQAMLDAAAKAKRYDDIRSAALRAGYPGPFQAEGIAFAQWMDACWSKCYEVLAAVNAGERDEPTVDELLDEMPPLALP